MTNKHVTIVGLDSCSYTKTLRKNLAANTPPHLKFTYVECGGDFERKCGGDGKTCASDLDCHGFYTDAPAATCDLTPEEAVRKNMCNVQGFPTFKNDSDHACHLGYEATDHAGFLQKIENKC